VDVQQITCGSAENTMETLQGTIRLQRTGQHWRARFACALVITVLVGVCSYAVTYRALVLISTPGGSAATVPAKTYPVTPPTATPLASVPNH
jgi:hypothetical protein